MNKLYDAMGSPTGFDSWSNFMGERPSQDLYVVLGRNRDSSMVANSNWDTAVKMFDDAELDYDITSVGHWACGWIEYLSVDINDKGSYKLAEEIEASLADYPLLDDEDHSRREHEDAMDTIEFCIDSSFEVGEGLDDFSEIYSHLCDAGYCHSEGCSPSDEDMREAQWETYVKNRLTDEARSLSIGEKVELESWEISRVSDYHATAWVNDETDPRELNLFKDHPKQILMPFVTK